MSIIKNIKFIIPLSVLFFLLLLLWHELFYSKQNELTSSLIGENIPSFHLDNLFLGPALTEQELNGQVSLLNFWATWCYACGLEQDMLLKIKNQYHVAIYGIDYKDNDVDAKNWLKKSGNPYVKVGKDINGEAAVDLGIYGTPETFVINKKGQIIYRHIGVIDQQTWDEVLYPLIKKYQQENISA